jgi:hypothetical protein
MVGYQSKKFLAESREPFAVNYNDIEFEKMNPELFYNLRHLKLFQERTKSNKTKWFCSWDHENILIYDNQNNMICKLDDIVLAEYITSLHNMSIRLIREVEEKYAG